MDLIERLGESPAVETIKDFRERCENEKPHSKLSDHSSFVALVGGAYLGYCNAKGISVDSGLNALFIGGPLVASFIGTGLVRGSHGSRRENLKELEEKYKKIDLERISGVIAKYEQTHDVQGLINPNELKSKILDEICKEVAEKRDEEMEHLFDSELVRSLDDKKFNKDLKKDLSKRLFLRRQKKFFSNFVNNGVAGIICSATDLGLGYTLGYCAGRFF